MTKFTDTARTPAADSKIAGETAAGLKGHFLASALKTLLFTGTSTNDNAAAGEIGQILEAQVAAGSAISVLAAAQTDITSITLTAGDWDVYGNISYVAAAGTTIVFLSASISLTSNTSAVAPDSLTFMRVPFTIASTNHIPAPPTRILVASSTPVYLVARADFAVSTMTSYGKIWARRAR